MPELAPPNLLHYALAALRKTPAPLQTYFTVLNVSKALLVAAVSLWPISSNGRDAKEEKTIRVLAIISSHGLHALRLTIVMMNTTCKNVKVL